MKSTFCGCGGCGGCWAGGGCLLPDACASPAFGGCLFQALAAFGGGLLQLFDACASAAFGGWAALPLQVQTSAQRQNTVPQNFEKKDP